MKTTLLKIVTVLIAFLSAFSASSQNLTISGGFAYSLVVCSSGKVFAWGDNSEGQIGREEVGVNTGVFVDRTAGFYDTPQVLGGLPEIFQVDAGSGGHAIGLTCNNQVVTWGANCKGQLGGGAGTGGGSCTTPGATLSRDPVFVVGVGGVGTLDNVTYVSAATAASYAITQDGRVVSWGTNDKSELGRDLAGGAAWSPTPGYVLDGAGNEIMDIVFVEGTDFGAYALTATGQIYSWGQNGNSSLGREVTVANPENRAGLVVDGTGAPLQDMVIVSAGDTHGMTVDVFGNVWAWGGDWAGQIGNGQPFHNDEFALRVIGGESGESFLGDVDPVIKIAAGQRNSAAVTASGKFYVWGSPSNGAGIGCYDGVTVDINTGQAANADPETAPVLMDLDNVVDISDGDSWFFAITDDGTVYVDGSNEKGQQGIGGTTNTCGWEVLNIPDCELSFPCPDPELVDVNVCLGDAWEFNGGIIPPGFTATWTRPDASTFVETNPLGGGLITTKLLVSGVALTDLGNYTLQIVDARPATNRPCVPCPTVNVTGSLSLFEANFADPTGLEFCATSLVNVTESGAATSSANEYQWFANQTGGTSLGFTIDEASKAIPLTGVTYSGIAPDRTAIIWVEDVSSVAGTVRPSSELSGYSGGTLRNSPVDPASAVGTDGQKEDVLVFDALVGFTLTSISVEVGGYNAADIDLHVRNAAGVSLGTLNLLGASLANGVRTSVTLTGNVVIPPGSGYFLELSATNNAGIWWYQNGPTNSYPSTYDVAGTDIVRVVGNSDAFNSFNAEWSSPSYFDWGIETGSPYPCGRVPVLITEVCPKCNKPTSVDADVDATICEGDANSFAGSYVDAGVAIITGMNYVWFNETDRASVVASDYTAIGTIADLVTGTAFADAGTYVLRVQDGTDPTDTECYTEESVTLTVNKVPDLSVVDPLAVCSPSTVDITGTWTDGEATLGTVTYHDAATATAANEITNETAITTDGTYYVKVDNASCTDIEAIVVTINPLPIAPTTTDLTYCVDETSVVLTATGAIGNTLNWYIDNTTATALGSAPIPSTTTAGTTTYYVSQETAAGCEGPREALAVTVNENPVATIEAGSTLCTEDLVSSDLTVTVSGGTPDYTVTYDNPSLTGQTLTIPTGLTGDITGLEVGSYTLTRVEDDNGCFTDLTGVTTMVGVHPDLTVTGPDVTCNFVTKEATVTGVLTNGVPVNYAIDLTTDAPDGTGGITSPGMFSATFLAIGNTTYNYDFTDGTSCDNNVGKLSGIIDCDCPVVGTLTGGGDICATAFGTTPASQTLTVAVSGSAAGTSAAYSVTIENTDGDVQTGTRTGDGDITFTVTIGGTYSISTVSDATCTGAGSGSSVVTVLPATIFTTDLDNTALTLCPTDPLNLSAVATGDNVMYEWFQGMTSLGAASTTNTYDVASAVPGTAGTYTVVATGTCGAITSNDKVITMATDVVITLDLSTTELDLCPGDALNLGITATGTPETGNALLTYGWSQGGSTTDSYAITVNAPGVVAADAGDYEVTVTGFCGTETSVVTPVKVGVTTNIDVQPSLTETNLCPNEDFTLEVEASGDDLTYVWTHTPTTGTPVTVGGNSATLTITGVDASSAGAYTVEVTGKCGDETSAPVNITIGTPTEIALAGQPADVSICAASSASFSVTATGDALTYQWFKGGALIPSATASSYSGITSAVSSDAGNYTVVVTGACGVVTSDIAVLAITDTEVPVVTLTPTTTVCQGANVLFTAGSSGGGNSPLYTFREKGGAELQASSLTPTYTLPTIGSTITVEVSMLSNSTCLALGAINPAVAEVIVTVIEPATATITVPATDPYLTATDNVTGITATTTVQTGVTYVPVWEIVSTTNTATPVITSGGNLVTDLTGLSTIDGETDLRVTIQDVGMICPSASATVKIIRKDVTIPLIGQSDICIDALAGGITITGNTTLGAPIETPTMIGLVTGKQANAAGGTVSTGVETLTLPTNTAAGVYTAEYQIFNSLTGETSIDTASFEIFGLPTIADAGTKITTCSESVNLAGNVLSTGTTGLWTCDAGVVLTNPTSRTAELSGLTNGSTVECTWTTKSSELCPSSTSIVEIEKVGDVTTPAITLNGDTVTGQEIDICISDNYNLIGASPVGSGESGAWTTLSGSTVTGVTTINPVHGALMLVSPGASTLNQTIVQWTITSDVPGCAEESRMLTLNVHDEPIADIIALSTNDICQDNTPIAIETEVLGPTDQSDWSSSSINPTGIALNNWILDARNMNEGINTITYIVENKGCGIAMNDTTINIDPMVDPTIKLIGLDTVCEGSNVSFTAVVNGTVSAPIYEWQYNLGPNQEKPKLDLVNVQKSSAWVVVTLTSEKCVIKNPKDSMLLEVVTGPDPMISIENNLICETDSIVIEGEDLFGLSATDYQWYRNGILIVGENDKNRLMDLQEEGVYIYTLIAMSSSSCPDKESNSITLTVSDLPEVDASANGINPIEGFEGDDLNLSGSYVGDSAEWSNDEGINIILDKDSLESPLITEEGIYVVTLTASKGVCTLTDSVVVKIRIPIYAPNVFTVNGDGINETFHINGLDTYPDAVVTIFNRWGNEVYRSRDYPSNEWDGSINGAGVYYYIINNLEGVNLKADGYTGIVHLLRE